MIFIALALGFCLGVGSLVWAVWWSCGNAGVPRK